jgi:hypothetical protein
MKKLWWIIGGVIILLGIAGGLWYWHTAPDRELRLYMQLESQVQDVTRAQGAEAGVAFLQQKIHDVPSIENICHPLAHEIGRTAFERDGLEKALHFEYDLCGGGYVHGVVERYMKDIPDLAAALNSICPPDSPKCFHGIGHGLMLRTQNDLPLSLEDCHTFVLKSQRVQCAEGVFMENFEADLIGHTTNYLKPEDPYFPCRGRDEVDEGVCAFYVARYFIETHGPHYDDAIRYCEEVPAGPRDACYKGLGDTAMKYHISDPQFAKTLCESITGSARTYCMQGMTSYFIVHFASAKKGNELCALLGDLDKPACTKVVQQNMAVYPN